jgi:HSP20 family protein
MMRLVHATPVAAGPFSEMDRLFDSFFSGSRGANIAQRFSPAIDVAETENELVLTADLPGIDESDIAIEVKDGVLSISGERRDNRESAEGAYRRVERSFGRFSRAMRLPRGTDPAAVSANFDRGVLEVRIAKPEITKPHRVEIGAGSGQKAIEAEGTEKP